MSEPLTNNSRFLRRMLLPIKFEFGVPLGLSLGQQPEIQPAIGDGRAPTNIIMDPKTKKSNTYIFGICAIWSNKMWPLEKMSASI